MNLVQRIREWLPRPTMLLAWIIISAACVGTYSVYRLIQPTLDRAAIFPDADKRFDITELEIGLLSEVCPTNSSIDSRAAFEKCLRDGEMDEAYSVLKIPTIDRILETYPPRFRDLLTDQGYGELRKELEAKQPYVVRVRVPSEFVSDARLVDHRHVLTFHGMLNAIACIGGECNQQINKHDPEHRGIALYSENSTIKSNSTRTIHLFAIDSAFLAGVSLMSGIFVTNQKQLQSIYQDGPIIKQGKSLIFIALFAGLVLAAFIYCLASGFLDYASLAFLAFSMSLFIVGEQYGLFAGMKVKEFYEQRAFIDFNLLIAATLFAATTSRIQWRGLVLIVCTLYSTSAVVSFYLLPSDLGVLVNAWPVYTQRAANYLFWVPPGICLAGGVNCLFLALEAKRNRLGQATINDFLRRGLIEQPVYMLVLGYFGYNALNYATVTKAGIVSERFLPNSALTFFVLFAVMVTNSLVRHRIAVQNANDLSESDRVRIRVGPKALARFHAQHRWGAFLLIDLKGSSLASTKVGPYMHDIMSELGEAIYLSHQKAGRSWFHDTTLGDEWVIAMKPAFTDPQEELASLISITQANIESYLNIVKFFERSFDVKLSLHVSAMIVSDYTLGSGERKPYNPSELKQLKKDIDPGYIPQTFRRKPDFLGPEINFMMKYAGKPPAFHMTIVGREDFLPLELGKEANKQGRIIDTMKEHKAADASIEAAKPMNLFYIYLPWRNTDTDQIQDTKKSA